MRFLLSSLRIVPPAELSDMFVVRVSWCREGLGVSVRAMSMLNRVPASTGGFRLRRAGSGWRCGGRGWLFVPCSVLVVREYVVCDGGYDVSVSWSAGLVVEDEVSDV